MIPSLNPHQQRAHFPALQRQVNGQPAIYFDGPGGTQVPQSVIDAISGVLARGVSNDGGPFASSQDTDIVVKEAHQAVADLLNAQPNEIAFGQNMTSLTFAFSRALAKTWNAGDNIVLTRLDHDANISPWLMAAEDHGVEVRWLDFDPTDCTLRLDTLPDLLDNRTRLVAITYASNATGSITDIKRTVQIAHSAGALVYVDAVHFAPHGLLDVRDLDCDFLACSVYKYFGPHTGVLYGRYALMAQLTAYKVRPAPTLPPGKWQTGTQSFESLAGVTAAINYLAAIGKGTTRRAQLADALERIKTYEEALSLYFLQRVTEIKGLRVYGVTDVERLDERTPTFAISIEGYTPAEISAYLGENGVFVWHGHYYAVAVMERLGLLDQGGLVRVGFVHYNTTAEIDRLIDLLKQIGSSGIRGIE